MKTYNQFLNTSFSEEVKPEPPELPQEDPQIKSKEKRQMQIKKQVLLKKMQAVRAGAGADIVASYTPEGEMVEGKVSTGPRLGEPREKGATHVNAGEGEKIQKRTKKWMDKKGQKGAPGLDAMKARTAEHKAKRGVKEEVVDEGKKKGLWDNIHAKRKRGEKPAKPGDKDYPKTLNVEGLEKARKNVGADKCWDGYKAKGTKKKGGKEVPNCVKEGAAWTKKSGKNPEGGLNEKGRKSYERENPGSDLKAPQPEGGSRKKSFCARMKGMRKRQKPSNNTGKDRLSLSLKKWKCNEEKISAFDFVKKKIEKEVGKSGYVSKDNPRKPQSSADKAKARAHQAKVDKENAAERAKDPSQGRYPKG